MSSNERMSILEMIDAGKITAEQGLLLLQSLAEGEEQFAADLGEDPSLQPGAGEAIPGPEPAGGSAPDPGLHPPVEPGAEAHSEPPGAGAVPAVHQSDLDSLPPEIHRWQYLWLLPFSLGAVLTLFAMYQVFQLTQASSPYSALFCPGVVFVSGIVILVLGWDARRAHWIHLRIEQPPGEWPRRIFISFPLPLGLLSWFLRRKGKISQEKTGQTIEAVIEGIKLHASAQNPLLIEVDEGDGGNKVKIYVS